MSKEAAIEKLKRQQQNKDLEDAHIEADMVLCELLEALGMGEVVWEFNKIDKWYA